MKKMPEMLPTGSSIVELYRRCAPTIFAYLRSRTPSREDAEDILLEVFLAALQAEQLAKLSETRQLAWLQQVARHKLADFYRGYQKSNRHQMLPLEEVADSIYDSDDLAPEQLALRAEEYEHLHRKMALLPAMQQRVLQLRFGDDLRYADIAATLGKSEGAVRMLLMRALNFLRDIYKARREEL